VSGSLAHTTTGLSSSSIPKFSATNLTPKTPPSESATGSTSRRRLYSSPVKTLVFVALCSVLASCASPRSNIDRTGREPTPAAVARRTELLSVEFARVERRQTNPEMRRAVRRARKAWIASLRARREGDAMLAAQSISLDAKYYRLRHRLLDAEFEMIQRLQPAQ
jgi:hypothetical protein